MRVDSETALFLVRHELFEVADEPLVGALVFGAMERAHVTDLPSDASELLAFVRGPLRDVVEERLGPAHAERVVEAIAARITEDAWRRNDEVSTTRTKELAIGDGPLRVVVISPRPLAGWLRAALAEHFVDVRSLAGTSGAAVLMERLTPAVVIVDASDGLRERAEDVAGWLASVQASRVIFGTDGAWASALRARLDALGVVHVPVDPREGVEPLLDLVRSHARGGQ